MRYYAGVGARVTPLSVLQVMTSIAREMFSGGWILRSGGAVGADTAFAIGAGPASEILRARDCTPEALKLSSLFHPKWSACPYKTQLLHGRNAMIVLGPDLQTPVEHLVCWTPDGLPVGGTGQAIRIAEAHGIPVINLAVPEEVQGRLL